MDRHDTLLIACGSQTSRNHLRSVLQERFNLLEAHNTRQMLLLLEQNLHCIASVVLDISNWDVIDRDIFSDSHTVELLRQLPVIVIADKESYQDLTLYFRYGAADVIPLNYDPYAMLHRIETITALTLHKKTLENMVAEKDANLRHFSNNIVDALSAIIEYRSLESGHHILRIRNFTRILLEEVMGHCPEYGLTPRMISIISSASALHDVGKIAIPDAILTKPGKLTSEEWEIMKTHSVLGCELLSNLDNTVDQDYLTYAYNICRYHHERWDGRGYPDALREDEIPICAQIVGLADCYDALTSKRVYKDAYSHTTAVNMILAGECGAFSPKLLECFKNILDEFSRLREEYADGRDPGKAIADMSISLPAASAQSVNLLEKTQAKYYSLVHYINAFLMEVQLDTGLFQVIYNPYPALLQTQGVNSLTELTDIAARYIVVPEEQERMYQVIQEEIPRFIQQDLRRQSFYFHHRAYSGTPSGAFEMTFLRIGGINRRPSLAILCRTLQKTERPAVRDDRIMENFTECTYICHNDSSFTLVRPGKDTHSLGGYTPKEVMDIFGGRLLDMAFPEDRQLIRQEFDRQLKNGPMVRTEYRFLCKDGSVGWVVNKSRLIMSNDGHEYLQSFLIDITDTKAAYDTLNETVNRYEIILAQTENVLFDLDMQTNQIEFPETWEKIFGYKPSTENLNHQLSGGTHVHPDDIPLILDRIALMQNGSDYEMVEIRIATDKGRYLWCRVRGSATRDSSGKLIRIVGMIINIDAEKNAQQELEDKANRDALTKLLNKKAGQQQVEQYLRHMKPDQQCAMIMLDLDNFKAVNDHYGHLFGDALLTQVSQILTNLFHSHDIISRIGGDEFMVLVRDVADRHLLASQCRRLRDMMFHTFDNNLLELKVGCSMGIALYPEHANTYFSLFTRADHALYQAKAKGKNDFCFYSDAENAGYVPSRHSATPIDSDNDHIANKQDHAHQTFTFLSQAADLNAAIDQVVARMGRRVNVSRAYIFENNEDNTYCSNTFEWCNEGITPEIQNLQYVSYETDIPDYQDNFNEDDVFYCHDVRDLPPATYEIVAAQGIKSMLHCAIRENGVFRGYIGFDECKAQRLWTKDEIQSLTDCSQVLSTFLLKHRKAEKLQREVRELRSKLEKLERYN